MAISTDQIMALGDDQLLSQFSLVFPNGIPGGGNAQAVALRMDTTIDPPEEAVNVYEIFHKGFKIPKTGMLQEGTKEFTVEVRIDQQWEVYDTLKNWSKLSYDHSNGTGLPDSMTRATIIVQPEDRSQTGVKQIIFRGCKPKADKLPTFDNQSGDPARVSLTFIFIKMEVE
jgi:hypothetical protein